MIKKYKNLILGLTAVVLVIGVLVTYETLKQLCCLIGGN